MSYFVAVMMGSDSDWSIMKETCLILKQLGIEYEVKVLSAHRTPVETLEYIKDAESRGCQVFIAGAGLAAHLPGVIASHTLKPVLGVPLEAGPLKGLDALYAIVQMPAGIPVGTLAIGKAGAKNAAWLSASILSLQDKPLADRLRDSRESQRKAVLAKEGTLSQVMATME